MIITAKIWHYIHIYVQHRGGGNNQAMVTKGAPLLQVQNFQGIFSYWCHLEGCWTLLLLNNNFYFYFYSMKNEGNSVIYVLLDDDCLPLIEEPGQEVCASPISIWTMRTICPQVVWFVGVYQVIHLWVQDFLLEKKPGSLTSTMGIMDVADHTFLGSPLIHEHPKTSILTTYIPTTLYQPHCTNHISTTLPTRYWPHYRPHYTNHITNHIADHVLTTLPTTYL